MSCPTCKSPSGDPHHQKDLFQILGYKVYQERYFSVAVVKCKSCGKMYFVFEDPSYHYPIYEWLTDQTYAEQKAGESMEQVIGKR